MKTDEAVDLIGGVHKAPDDAAAYRRRCVEALSEAYAIFEYALADPTEWIPPHCKSCGGPAGDFMTGEARGWGWPGHAAEPLCIACQNHMQVAVVFATLYPHPVYRRWHPGPRYL